MPLLIGGAIPYSKQYGGERGVVVKWCHRLPTNSSATLIAGSTRVRDRYSRFITCNYQNQVSFVISSSSWIQYSGLTWTVQALNRWMIENTYLHETFQWRCTWHVLAKVHIFPFFFGLALFFYLLSSGFLCQNPPTSSDLTHYSAVKVLFWYICPLFLSAN